MRRTAIIGVVALAVACGRSGLEFDDALGDGARVSGRSGSAPTGDDDVAGANAGGSPATGGVGGFPGGRASGGRGAESVAGDRERALRSPTPLEPRDRLEEPIAAVGSTLWSFNLQP